MTKEFNIKWEAPKKIEARKKICLSEARSKEFPNLEGRISEQFLPCTTHLCLLLLFLHSSNAVVLLGISLVPKNFGSICTKMSKIFINRHPFTWPNATKKP
jgi:hypothetical protein